MSHRLAVLSAVIAATLAGPALAQASIRLPTTPILIDDTVSSEEAQLQATLDQEERRLAPQRAAFVQHFRTAYRQYPAIPAGTLEALAFVQSRWMHMLPEHDHQDEAHNRMPAAWGVMGLYNGEGFADQVSEGARLLGVSADKVRTDPLTNILAAAALLDAQIKRDHPQAGNLRTLKGAALTPEAIRPALARYAGYSASPLAGGEVDNFARNSFAFDVLLAQDRGVDDRGIKVPERAIAWEDAFDARQLVLMRAPMVRLDVASDRIEIEGHTIDPVSETLVRGTAEQPATDVGIASTDYGPAIWKPAHSTNYTASRSAAVSAVTVHTTQGSYAGAISWFQNSSANVSAHYVIRSSDGQVTQMVRNAHTAWHVGNQNSYTLGIEHEGWVNNSSWYTDAMYSASAALVRNFCSKYSAISCASAYKGAASSGINVLATSVKIKGHQHYAGQTHTDPGINWNWSKYYNLINPGGGGGGTTRPAAAPPTWTALKPAWAASTPARPTPVQPPASPPPPPPPATAPRARTAAAAARAAQGQHRHHRQLVGTPAFRRRHPGQQRQPDPQQRQGRLLGVDWRHRHERTGGHRRQRRHRALHRPLDSGQQLDLCVLVAGRLGAVERLERWQWRHHCRQRHPGRDLAGARQHRLRRERLHRRRAGRLLSNHPTRPPGRVGLPPRFHCLKAMPPACNGSAASDIQGCIRNNQSIFNELFY